MDTDQPQSPLDQENSANQAVAMEPASEAKTRRGWKKYLVYGLAVLGVLFVMLICALAYSQWKDSHQPIPETAAIESTMSGTFGRYSDEHKGWLYVSDDKRSYVMRVVQQASIDNKREGDGLYFVASGTPLDDQPGTIYGVFYLYKDAKSGELQQVASLYQNGGDRPLTPENVRFEALSNQVWAWVIKESPAVEDLEAGSYVVNVVLAPHDGSIKELARFNAQQKTIPEGGCAKADRDYADWQKAREQSQAQAAADAAAVASGASEAEAEQEGNADETEYDEPPRCDDLKWTYKTNPPKDGALTPLLITRIGILQGVTQPEQTWKVMFDSKSFVYLLPDELK